LFPYDQSLTCVRGRSAFDFCAATKLKEIPMWKALVAGIATLTIAGSTFVSAQQPSSAERSHHVQLTADDIAAFTDARLAALKAALKLTPTQEKNWPAVEQALRDNSKERIARREAREAAGDQSDATERLRDRADALTARAAALRRLADAEKPLYQSLDEAQKRRFGIAFRFAERWHHMAEARWHGEGTPEHAH
jgi:zinc resistance-associated protein